MEKIINKNAIRSKLVPMSMSFTLFFISFTTQVRASELRNELLSEPLPTIAIDNSKIPDSVAAENVAEKLQNKEIQENPYIEEVKKYYEEINTYGVPSVEKEIVEEPVIVDIPYEGTILPADIIKYAKIYCGMNGLDLDIALANFYHESRFKPTAVNKKSGCKGLGQIKVSCHKDRIERLGVTDILDAESNIKVSCDYIHELLESHDGDYEAALIDYNKSSKFTKTILRTAEKNKPVIDLIR